MGKYATGQKPDMTNNFFLMQDLDLALFHEVSELVWAATYDAALHVRIMKRITDAAHSLDELTNGFDGVSGGEISYNWLPVCFYMAITRGGKVDEYNGFRVTVSCTGVHSAIEIFFAKEGTYGQTAVWGRSELGGWTNRLPKTPPPEIPVAEAEPAMEVYTVWNEMRTEGFTTTDKGLAYEVRKCATSNLSDEFGRPSSVARAFCERWGDDNLVTETQMKSARLRGMTDQGLEDLFKYYSIPGVFGRFIYVQNKRHEDPTVHAILLLNEKAVRMNADMPQPVIPEVDTTGPTNHDPEAFIEKATRDDVMELVRCGVRFHSITKQFTLPTKDNK
jgi:hypothetical protein